MAPLRLFSLAILALASGRLVLANTAPGDESLWTIQQGEVTTDPGDTPWKFIGSYCFDTKGLGEMRWSIELEDVGGSDLVPVANETTGYQLSLYDDQDSSFPIAWHKRDKWTCEELLVPRRNLNYIAIPAGMKPDGHEFREKFKDHNSGHQWFVVVSACGVPRVKDDGMRFKYILKFSNSGNRTESMELSVIPAPTAIYACLLIVSVALFAFSTIFRTKLAGAPLVKSHAHRSVTAVVFFFLIANICMWAWSGAHEASALSAFLFFQGVHQVFIFMIILWIAVSSIRDRGLMSRILGDVYAVFAFLYFIFWWTMSFEEFFPGVTGGTVYSNGLTVTASVFRTVLALLFAVLYSFGFPADKGVRSNLMLWLIIGVLGFAYLWLPMIALWTAYGDIFSCDPGSLTTSTWTNVWFDGLATVILILLVDVEWSAFVHGSMNRVAPSLLDEVNPHNWGDEWEDIRHGFGRSYGGLAAQTSDGIVVDDDPGTEIPDSAAAGSGSAPHKSYGTL